MIAISTPVVGLAVDEKENVMVGKGSDAKESNEKQMPEGFAPSHFDVLVGWARQNFHHGEKEMPVDCKRWMGSLT